MSQENLDMSQEQEAQKKFESVGYTPSHVANYFIYRAEEENVNDLTVMKLLKLVYFSYAWSLAVLEKKIFAEPIEAWPYGPVIPSIYHEFKDCGVKNITRYSVKFDLEKQDESYPIIETEKEPEISKVLGAVWAMYKDCDGWNLSEITHEKNSPWDKTIQERKKIMQDAEIEKRAWDGIEKFSKK